MSVSSGGVIMIKCIVWWGDNDKVYGLVGW